MRSRVMPGSLVTMARRVPVKRLKRVDLPTLGRPRITRDGRVVVMKLGSGAVLHCNVSRRGTKAAKARTRRRHLVAEKIQYKGIVSERGYTPGSLYEYQNKGLTKFAFRKLLILKGTCDVPEHKLQLGLLKIGLATFDRRQAVQAQMRPLMIVVLQKFVQDPHAGLGR